MIKKVNISGRVIDVSSKWNEVLGESVYILEIENADETNTIKTRGLWASKFPELLDGVEGVVVALEGHKRYSGDFWVDGLSTYTINSNRDWTHEELENGWNKEFKSNQ